MALGKGAGECLVHQEKCSPVKRATHIMKSGFSCKSFSKLNSEFAKNIALARKDEQCSSVRTFLATINVMILVRPPVVVLENVDAMTTGSSTSQGEINELSNLRLVIQALETCDGGAYRARVFRLNTADFLLPQSRRVGIMNVVRV